MYAVISTNRDGRIKVLRTCCSREAVAIAYRLAKEISSGEDRNSISAVIMDDGGYQEIQV